ncbi:MAG: HIT domain-containing protein [Candidatus Dojkabacteria bacterium]|nr:MAG: HIT domain-containing protein [Candidatus Dojkabacteria bacterium]
MPDCIFCKIAKNEIPSYRLYETDNFIVMLDAFPKAEGHTLIIPKEHYPQVWDVPAELYQEYMDIVRKTAISHKEKTGSQFSYSMIAGNQIAHAHIHVIPNIGKDFMEIIDTPAEKIDPEQAERLLVKLKISE